MRTIDFTYRNFYRLIGHGQDFRVEFDPCSRPPRSYYEEFCSTARHIDSLKTGRLYLMYSGGLDSEYALAVFLSLGIDITPVIVRLQPDYNQHDVDYAVRFCQANGVDPLYIDIDFDDFVLSGRMLEIATETMCGTHQLPATMYAAKQLTGTILVGGGDPHCALDTDTGQWNLAEIEPVRSWQTWFETYGINGTSMIMGYTPEMLVAYLTDPRIVDVVNHRLPGKLGTYSSKIYVYNRWGSFEPRTKYTGYERIESSPIFQSPQMKEFLDIAKQWNGRYLKPYQDAVDSLTSAIRGPVSFGNSL